MTEMNSIDNNENINNDNSTTLNEQIQIRSQIVHQRFNRVRRVEELRKLLLLTIQELHNTSDNNKIENDIKPRIVNVLIELSKTGDNITKINIKLFKGILNFGEILGIHEDNYKTQFLRNEALEFITAINNSFETSINTISSNNDKSTMYQQLMEIIYEVERLRKIEFYCPFDDLAYKPLEHIFNILSTDIKFNKNILYPLE